jgi:hypothetical protein
MEGVPVVGAGRNANLVLILGDHSYRRHLLVHVVLPANVLVFSKVHRNLYLVFVRLFLTVAEICLIPPPLKESRPEVQLRLNALLITPVQRIPRYKMLLEDVIKNTPECHPDKKSLTEALEQVK